MIPYSRQLIQKNDIEAVNKVLKSNYLTQGPIVEKFEKNFSKYCNVNFAVSVNSATSGLHIACLSLNLKKDDILWTTPISFIASANCALYCGAKVDFVDIDINTFNIDTSYLKEKLKIAKLKKKLPKIIVVVHIGGAPCDLKEIKILSKKYKFKIIEDAAHAIGSIYQNHKIGDCKYSDISVFSFHPVKTMTTCEGGMITTNSKKIFEKLKILREHGIRRNFKKKRTKYYDQVSMGFNYRLDELQSALGIEQLKNIDKWIKYKNYLAERYKEKLKDVPVSFQKVSKNNFSSYHLFIILIKQKKLRDKIFEKLILRGIGVNIHYRPIYKHSIYKKYKILTSKLVNSEEYYSRCISIPLYSNLSIKDQDYVIKNLKKLIK